jgi:hypothetical protein
VALGRSFATGLLAEVLKQLAKAESTAEQARLIVEFKLPYAIAPLKIVRSSLMPKFSFIRPAQVLPRLINRELSALNAFTIHRSRH